ncbi:MAG: class I SAM-dependent methyltransferase, partial [Actinobacteria bacterium]|nr:class I SAM-dependent methyltransferase [Actinomycetota bacterium]
MRDAAARAMVGAVLGRTRGGEIEVVEDGRSRVYGEPSELRATVRIKDPAAWRGPLNGSIGLGESYVDGLWETDDLVALIQIAARSLARQHRGVSAAVARSRAAFHRLRGLVPENTKGGARANISAHYDLGNDLFSAFLDPTMMYSCAYFPRDDASLEEAQRAKLDRICEQLRLGPDIHLLEIGTGWGGMAMHAARTTGCRVTTTTISRAQHELATQRVREAGLEDRVTILLEDYRDLRGTYDRLVSIEMIEAVGWQYFDTYFEACDRLLADDGLFLLQAITVDDRLYEMEKASKSFANTHVFPGGCLPSLKRIADSIGTVTQMREIWLDDIT